MRIARSVRPISYVKAHATDIVREVAETGAPVVVTVNGEAKVVIQDVASFDAMQEALALLKLLAQSRASAARGEVVEAGQAFDELEDDPA